MSQPDFLQLQPTNVTCAQVATAMLLHWFDKTTTVEGVLQANPAPIIDGKPSGSTMQALASYCRALQYDVTLYSFDAMLLDVQWNDMSDE